MTGRPFLRDLLTLLAVSAAAGFAYNAFAPDGIPLIRKAPVKIQVSDEEIFGRTPAPGPGDAAPASAPAGAPDSAAAAAPRGGLPTSTPPRSDAAAHAPDTGTPGRTAGEAPSTPGETAFRIITLDQMQRILRERRGLIVDARAAKEFEAGHIAGAVNFYAVEPEGWVERIAELPRDTMVAIYCGNPHCPYGRDVAEFLTAFGFTNLLLYDDGWDGWTAAGLPVVTGGEER